MPYERITSIEHEPTEYISYQQKPCHRRFLKTCQSNLLSILTFVGVLLGIGIGIGIRTLPISTVAAMWIAMPGTIYLRLLQLTILPMIAGRVFLVTAGLDPKKHGRIGVIALIYVFLANFIGAGLGLAVSLLMHQNTPKTISQSQSDDVSTMKSPTTSDIFADLLYNMFPDNILSIGIFNTGTRYLFDGNSTNGEKIFKRVNETRNGTNMIGLLFAATLMGLAAQKVGQKSTSLLKFFDSSACVVEQIVKWILKFTPIGVCFMIAGAIVSIHTELDLILTKLGWFFLNLLIALLIQLVFMVILVLVLTKRNPFKFFFVTSANAYLISVATGVPLVAIPHMYEACDKNGISTRVSRFVAPLGAVLKSDGSALFIMTALVFCCSLDGPISEHRMTDLGVASLICGVLAFAVPPVPSASLLIIITIVSSLGVNADEAVGMLFAIDWLNDRLRAGNSTLSTLTCILLTNKIGKHFDPEILPLLEPVDESPDLEIDDEIPVSPQVAPTIDVSITV